MVAFTATGNRNLYVIAFATLYNDNSLTLRCSFLSFPNNQSTYITQNTKDPSDKYVLLPHHAAPHAYLTSFIPASTRQLSLSHHMTYPLASPFHCTTVVAADSLIKRDILRLPDPFAIVSVDSEQIHTTSVIKRTLNPYWNE